MTTMWGFTRVKSIVRCGILMIGTVLTFQDATSRINAQSLTSPSYTAAQASQGRPVYALHCASCHGAHLDDGEFAPPLKGAEFRQRWGPQSAENLFSYMSTRMPPARPALADEMYVQLLAYMLQENGQEPGSRELPADPGALKSMGLMLAATRPGVSGGLVAGVVIPPPPVRLNPLSKIRPVTDGMLNDPPDGEWLTWRRTPDGLGFSPLKQINKRNVSELRIAWAWSLPPGPNENTPLFHDGVLFVHSFGDKLQAIDAVTGDLLWQYSRRLPKGVAPSFKRGLSIYGEHLYVATSDAHVVALDVKTGNVVWDTVVGDPDVGLLMTGGTLVAQGKVMAATKGRAPGGNYIVGLDAATGREVWRFHTIARPDAPGGDSWNGLPLEKRNGASVWVPGTYDPVLKLAFFGPAQTYDTGPLRNLAGEGVTNDALYTDSTVGLDPDSGKLVWYFQHQPNDQWDLDWAFERQIINLPVNGISKRVVVTGGKQTIFDVLDARTGKYEFSIDLGLQNVVTSIDPKTGAKIINRRLIPGDGKTKMICPHISGGRAWPPTSYDPTTRILYIPLVEACMDLRPVEPGERGVLSTGVRHQLRPPPDSDGKYGRLQAINLETRKTVWVERQRATQTTGTLATAGGLVFAGSVDRVFRAYDAATGRKLWKARLNDVPSSAPITYLANGKQYVAVVVGNGGNQATSYDPLVPEIQNPPDGGAAIWVFELPTKSETSAKDQP